MFINTVFHDGCTQRFLVAEPLNSDAKCVNCKEKVRQSDPKWIITRLPCPILESQIETACCIVIKPSHGYFQNYKIGDDLHIGIADSHGVVYSFWTKGVESHKITWQDSTKIHDFHSFFFDNLKNCDNCIEFFIETLKISKKFHKSKYDENSWNCFDFVLEFVKFINFRNYSKLDFIEEFVTKKMQNVVKYCILFHKLSAANK